MAPIRIISKALICITAVAVTVLRAQEEAPVIKNAAFEAGAEPLLRRAPFILLEGGVKLIDHEGARWFVAVGMTSVGAPSAEERLRMIKVGRINAIRAAAEFYSATEVETKTILSETTTITTSDGKKTASSHKTLDDVTRTKMQAALKVPTTLGTWESADGKLFFYAIGAKL